MGRSFAAVLLGLCLLSELHVANATEGPRRRSRATPAAGAAVDCPKTLAGDTDSVGEFLHLRDVYPLSGMLTTLATDNLAVRHPTIMMNAYQLAWGIIRHIGTRSILEPTYRSERINVWRAFAEPSRSGVQIIEQYAAVDGVVSFLREGASGTNSGSVLSLDGPAGTGKTEFLKSLHLRRAELMSADPNFYEFRFRWRNLHQIRALQALQDESHRDQPFPHQMGRTPIVLLPKGIQQKLVALTRDRVVEMTGYEPLPFQNPDPQTKAIIEAIIAQAYPNSTPTEAQYVAALEPFVEIIRIVVDPEQPPVFVRNQGRDVEWDKLFMAQNPFTRPIYGASHPLSYDYTGLVLRADGFGLFFDEFWRNIAQFRNVQLDTAQNRVVQRGGAPAVFLNSFILFADNDESIDAATEQSESNAQIDRSATLPMRMPLHPTVVAKVVLMMAMQEWGARKFWMQALDVPNAPKEPLDINKVFPDADENGNLPHADGRYAIGCALSNGRDVLIAPRTLYLLGITAAASRLVTDPAKLSPHLAEFDMLKPGSNEFLHPVTRLQIILGQLPASEAIRSELQKLRILLKEGSVGISPRNAKIWLLTALRMAGENESATLTPAVLDRAFERCIDNGNIRTRSRDTRARWVLLHNQMKAGLLLPALMEDVLTLLSEEIDLNETYQEVERDLIALFRNPEATEREGVGVPTVAIRLDRLRKIEEVYLRQNGRELAAGEVANFVLRPSHTPSDRHDGLLRAIKGFLYETRMDAASLDQFLRYFQTTTGEEAIRRRAERARREMTRHGYNLQSLSEAMSMARDLLRDQERRRTGN